MKQRLIDQFRALPGAGVFCAWVTTERVTAIAVGVAIGLGSYLSLNRIKLPPREVHSAQLSKVRLDKMSLLPRVAGLQLTRPHKKVDKMKLLARLAQLTQLPPVYASSSCSESTIKGSYSGYTWGKTGSQLNDAVEGYYFDGSLYYYEEAWGMVGGSTSNPSSNGDYGLGSDCTGYLQIEGVGEVAELVATSNGSDIFIVPRTSQSQIVTHLRAW
jgi:hypothetical protein